MYVGDGGVRVALTVTAQCFKAIASIFLSLQLHNKRTEYVSVCIYRSVIPCVQPNVLFSYQHDDITMYIYTYTLVHLKLRPKPSVCVCVCI